jgi:hypothetical protein
MTAISVSAHGTGVSFEETKEGYKIDIGHDEFIAALESTRFDFALYLEDISRVEGDVFTDAWVTITKDKKLYFGGAVDKPVFGATGFTFVFPEEGVYTIATRFQKDGETVIKTEFPLEIIPPLDATKEINPLVLYALLSFGSLCIGLCIGFLIPKKNKK